MADSDACLLGLDAGNTVIKAVLFDRRGRQLAMHAVDGRSRTPRPGHAERNLDELWTNACEAIRSCIARAAIDPARIAAVGCAGHGNGLYLLDAADRPLLGIQSIDTRAAATARSLAAAAGEALHGLCLQKPWPSQTPTLLAWVKQHAPETYRGARTLMLCKDFINFRLTGERVSDLSDMSGAGLLRMPDCAYDGRLLGLYGLEEAAALLPRLVDPAEVAGLVTARAAAETGLAEGTPVSGGFFDVVASAMGAGVTGPGQGSIIIGTWSINQVFSETPVVDPDVFMVAGFGPRRFVNIESSATSAANLEWYVRELLEWHGHHHDPFDYCNERVGSVAASPDEPFFLPFLYGSGRNPAARAAFCGVAGWHGEAHLLRALFEGVMFEHRRHIEVLTKAGVTFDRAVVSGGGSRSPHWPRLFADGLQVPVTVAQAKETGALGAAIGAGVAAGLFADYESGVAAMTRQGSTLAPDPAARGHYDRRYRIHRRLADTMDAFWAEVDAGDPAPAAGRN